MDDTSRSFVCLYTSAVRQFVVAMETLTVASSYGILYNRLLLYNTFVYFCFLLEKCLSFFKYVCVCSFLNRSSSLFYPSASSFLVIWKGQRSFHRFILYKVSSKDKRLY